MINVFPIVKLVTGVAASLSSGYVVGHAVKAVTPDNLKLIGKIGTAVGGGVLAFIAGDLAAKYVEEQVDTLEEGIHLGKNLGEKMAARAYATAKDAEIIVEPEDQED
jgi:hypothetical protein